MLALSRENFTTSLSLNCHLAINICCQNVLIIPLNINSPPPIGLPEFSLSFFFCHLSAFSVIFPFSSFFLLSSFLILFLISSEQIKNLPEYTTIILKTKGKLLISTSLKLKGENQKIKSRSVIVTFF